MRARTSSIAQLVSRTVTMISVSFVSPSRLVANATIRLSPVATGTVPANVPPASFAATGSEPLTLSVTLSFNNVPERLVVPLAAISIFADPSVNFALQFQPMDEDMGEDDFDLDDDGPDDDGNGGGKGKKNKSDEQTGEVVSLDQFRKK